MIRLFTALCKAFLRELNDEQLFHEATDEYIHHGKGCPRCGAVGKLTQIKGYPRSLTCCAGGKPVDSKVKIKRFLCGSCKGTHALLPDTLVPYSIYSLQFKLEAIIAYGERNATVVKICEAFDIAVSTLYEWKKLMEEHKDLMLGVLISQKSPNPGFLQGLLGSSQLSATLGSFFSKHGFSFMQGVRAKATRSVPP